MDGWWLGKGLLGWMLKLSKSKAALDVADPKTIDERRRVARDCQQTLQYGIRTYVDEMDDAVNKAYAAWPTRLFLIGLDGRVVYRGGLGPFDFHPYKLGNAIKTTLEQMES